MRRQAEDGGLLTPKQREWVEMISRFLQVQPKPRPPPPDVTWRRHCYHLCVLWPPFETVVFSVIGFNTLLMALDAYGLSAEQESTLDALNLVCTAVFVAEAAIKMAAIGVLP